jgi:hypothetical protein
MRTLIARCVKTVLVLSVLTISVDGEGNGMGENLPADLVKELSARTHATWEGVYAYSGASVIRIEGLRELWAITYRCEGHEGVLLDFAVVDDVGRLRFLQEAHQEAHEEVKGVTPVLDGIDVFPGDGQAEIIVRWRHPGQGGHRTIQKYTYTGTSMELVDQADFHGKHMGLKWVKSKPFTRW